MWGEITYPIPNFNGVINPQLYKGCNYLSMLGLKLIHVSKRALGVSVLWRQKVVSMTTLGFYPRPVLAFEASFGLRVLSLPASVCVCVRLCVNHLLVRAITRDLFKLGSPNLDQKCKRPWLRSLLFCGLIDLDLQGQIDSKVKIYPILNLSAP